MEVTIYDICRNCGGDGTYEYSSGDSGPMQCPCPGCGGSGRTARAKFELDVPSTAQFQSKFVEIENALQTIWNKVKDL